MANLRNIQRRIKSVRSTSQITRAMQLVASSKMKKAQNQAVAGRDYIAALAYVFAHLRHNISAESHPFLAPGKGDKELVLIIGTDKGLCGALNANLFKEIKDKPLEKTDYIAIGAKIASMLRRTRRNVDLGPALPDPVPLVSLSGVYKQIEKAFLSGKYSKVSIVFSKFINTLVQKPASVQLLPIGEEQLDQLAEMGKRQMEETGSEFVLEPSAEEVLQAILPLLVLYDIYQMSLEARASEHSARMVSMKAATENAQDIIKDLTLVFNKERQTAITSELTEISSAMQAME